MKNMLNPLKLNNFCNTTLVTCHQNTVKICTVSESNPSLSEAISEAILHYMWCRIEMFKNAKQQQIHGKMREEMERSILPNASAEFKYTAPRTICRQLWLIKCHYSFYYRLWAKESANFVVIFKPLDTFWSLSLF